MRYISIRTCSNQFVAHRQIAPLCACFCSPKFTVSASILSASFFFRKFPRQNVMLLSTFLQRGFIIKVILRAGRKFQCSKPSINTEKQKGFLPNITFALSNCQSSVITEWGRKCQPVLTNTIQVGTFLIVPRGEGQCCSQQQQIHTHTHTRGYYVRPETDAAQSGPDSPPYPRPAWCIAEAAVSRLRLTPRPAHGRSIMALDLHRISSRSLRYRLDHFSGSQKL